MTGYFVNRVQGARVIPLKVKGHRILDRADAVKLVDRELRAKRNVEVFVSTLSPAKPKPKPLRLRALALAKRQIGAVETSPNWGTKVAAYIRSNGGTGPEPWCGDFVAYCYKKAGSRAVTRQWASTIALASILTGTRRIKSLGQALPGDLIVFDWGRDGQPDHVGMLVKKRGAVVETIEGNTGIGGGRQGVGKKVRHVTTIKAIVRVLR